MTNTLTRNLGYDRDATSADLLAGLSRLLEDQQSRKVDVVTSSENISSRRGVIVVKGVDSVTTFGEDGLPDGADIVDGRYTPSQTFISSLATRLEVPPEWLRKQHSKRVDVFDQVVNRLLHGASIVTSDAPRVDYPADPRLHLFRGFTAGDDGSGLGLGRSLHSNAFQAVDHLDVLYSALDGIRDAGIDVEVTGADLTEYRMVVRINAPGIETLATDLLANYRDPWTGRKGSDYPVVNAGVVLSNSETGFGKWRLAPRITFLVCKNGQVIEQDVVEGPHLGARLQPGVVQWSASTQRKNIELIKSQARDAMGTFLNVEYLRKVVRNLTEQAGKPVTDAEETIKRVAQKLSYTETQRKGILDHFIKGADLTAGGVMNAITSWAQVEPDAEAAFAMENKAVSAMRLI